MKGLLLEADAKLNVGHRAWAAPKVRPETADDVVELLRQVRPPGGQQVTALVERCLSQGVHCVA